MARLLTEDEIRFRVSFEPEGFCWLEETCGNRYCSPAAIGPTKHGVTFPDGSGFADEVNVISLSESTAVLHVFDMISYGDSWRCWTTRPTKEERKNTPWRNGMTAETEVT